MALLSEGAHREKLDQGLAFGLGNLAWASGQTVAAAGSGALAQMTSDRVPYSLLVLACLATLVVVRQHKVTCQHATATAPAVLSEVSQDDPRMAGRPGARLGR